MNLVAQQKHTEPSLLAEGLMRLGSPSQRWPIVLCFLILSVAAFSGPVDIAEDPGGASIRLARVPSLLVKLSAAVCAGFAGVWGIACIPRVRELLFSPPGLILLAIACIFAMTCLTSVTSSSVPIALVFWAYLLFVPTCLIVLGLRGTLLATLCGVLLFTLGALFLYVFVPRFGVFPEDMGDGVLIERMGGMSQPNHTGRSAMIGLLISGYFFRLARAPKTLCLMLMSLFLLAGVLAMSRTALLAVFVCMIVLNLDRLLSRAGLMFAMASLIVIVAGVFALAATGREQVILERVLAAVTKTGDVEEVTSMTGRSEIWERSVELIMERPLQGYGLGANKIVLIDHLQSTHNILLHPTLAAGIVAGGLTLLLLMWNLITAFLSPQLIIRALCVYVLLSGLTEDTIYETFPGPSTLLWLTCCLWPMVRSSSNVPANVPS